MNKIIDFNINVAYDEVIKYVKNESQFYNLSVKDKIKLEQALYKLLDDSVITLDINIDEEDGEITILPILFNNKSIIKDKNILISNNKVINDETNTN